MTPNPIDRKGPFTTRVGRTYSGLAPSRAGRSVIRVNVGGQVLRTIRVRTAPDATADVRPLSTVGTDRAQYAPRAGVAALE